MELVFGWVMSLWMFKRVLVLLCERVLSLEGVTSLERHEHNERGIG